MGVLLLLLLAAAVLFALGFVIKLLWIAAGIVLVVWLVFFAGRRRRG